MADEIRPPSGPERGIRVVCTDHGEQTEFRPGRRQGTFYCEVCGVDVEVGLHDAHDWRDRGERC